MQAHPQRVWFGGNPGKICGKIGQNVWIPLENRFMCSDFSKISLQMQVQTIFLRSCFILFFSWCSRRFVPVWKKFGKNDVWSALIWKIAPNMRRNSVVLVFRGHFLGSIFRASLSKLGQIPWHLQKSPCSCTYAMKNLM